MGRSCNVFMLLTGEEGHGLFLGQDQGVVGGDVLLQIVDVNCSFLPL